MSFTPLDIDWKATGLKGGPLLMAIIGAHGLNLQDAAELAGRTPSTLSTIRGGKTGITRDTAEAYGDVFGVDPDLLQTTTRGSGSAFSGRGRRLAENLYQAAQDVLPHYCSTASAPSTAVRVERRQALRDALEELRAQLDKEAPTP